MRELRFPAVLGCLLFVLQAVTPLLANTAFAQIEVTKGPIIPPYPKEDDWYLSADDSTAQTFRDGQWTIPVPGKFRDIMVCNDLIILVHNRFYEPGRAIQHRFGEYEILATSSRLPVATASAVYCGDSILGYWTMTREVYFLRNRPGLDKAQRRLNGCIDARENPLHPMIVNDMEAFCLPQLAPNFYQCTSLKQDYQNWGMLGTNGQWIIAPQYDDPFTFENGIAEVRYYGQRRKINEQGEFVK